MSIGKKIFSLAMVLLFAACQSAAPIRDEEQYSEYINGLLLQNKPVEQASQELAALGFSCERQTDQDIDDLLACTRDVPDGPFCTQWQFVSLAPSDYTVTAVTTRFGRRCL